MSNTDRKSGPPPRRRLIPFDPSFLDRAAFARAAEDPAWDPDGSEGDTFLLLLEGGLDERDLDHLRLALRYDKPSVLAALFGVSRGQASRRRRGLLAGARYALVADAIRRHLKADGRAVLSASTGEPCVELLPDELIPAGASRVSCLGLRDLARTVRRVEADPESRGTHLCAVRVADGCLLWSAILPGCDRILPFTGRPAGEAAPDILRLRPAA